MKKVLSIITLMSLFTFNFSLVNAATWSQSDSTSKVDHFEVTTSPTSTKIWEAIDLIVKAVDKAWNVKKDYLWTIYVSVDNDSKATVPYVDWYQFVVADLWQKTFSKWLSFTKEWKITVTVLDIDNDNLEWTTEVTVSSAGTTSTTKWEITISSPDNGVTISDSKVKVTWNSRKNSKLKFFLNTKEVWESQTSEDWSFAYDMEWLVPGDNAINVQVLDWTDKVIAESDKIFVKLESSWPIFKNVIIKEWNEAQAWSQINIQVMAEEWLTEASVSINGIQEILKESATAWVYEWKITLPDQSWDYNVDVTLKNSLGKVTTKTSAITIKTGKNIFENVKSQVSDKKVTFTFTADQYQDQNKIVKFKIKYGTWIDLLTNESITFEKEKIKSPSDGTYSWYIWGLDMAKYYFQIYPLDKDQKEITWVKSDIIEADLSLSSAWKCMISNIANVKVIKKWDVTELSWDSIPDASSYNVYKKDSNGNLNLIENVTINKYTINISWDKISYDEFAIKWVCGDKESESVDYSNVVKVQTWPAQIAILIFISLIFAMLYFFIRRKKI